MDEEIGQLRGWRVNTVEGGAVSSTVNAIYLLNLGIAPYYTPVHQVNLNLPQTTVLHTIRLRLYLGLPMVYIAAMCMLSTNASRAAATVARAAPSEFPAMNSFRLFPSSSYSFLTVACMPLSPSHTVFRPSSKPYRHSRI